ncbi:hypothetical protein [Paenibacillus chitinolyticus]|uniref:hypothetical protein n=1 Tax=Paenibacillus chitinolyticus TaxID=79263 RepID=UPI003660E7F2
MTALHLVNAAPAHCQACGARLQTHPEGYKDLCFDCVLTWQTAKAQNAGKTGLPLPLEAECGLIEQYWL